MSWGEPRALLLLWALLPAALGWLWAHRRRARALQRLGPLVRRRAGPGALAHHRRRALLWLLALALGIVALARPRWGFRWVEWRSRGVDLAVVLDVSRSMDARDVSPSRMERARREVLDLADLLAGDRVGLVVFAAGAFPRMPLTVDVDALRAIVRDSSTRTLVAQGSDLGAGIDAAVALLGDAGRADRAILVVSDGEDLEGHALEAARRAAEAGIHLYAIGVGTPEGAPIPAEGGGFVEDGSGSIVLSRLGEDLLREIARIGEGAYARSVAGTADVRGIYVDEIRGRLQAAEGEARRERVWEERFQWPLAGMLVLLALSWLPERVRRRPARPRSAAVLAALALAAAAGGAQAAEEGTAEAGPAAADGASGAPAPADQAAGADEARIAELARRVAEHPGDLDAAEALGEALYRAGRPHEAAWVLEGVARRARDPERRARARYDAGLAAYAAGQLTRALEDWKAVLEERPDDADAARNAEIVAREIELRSQPPQQRPQDGAGEEQGGEGEAQPGGGTGGGDTGSGGQAGEAGARDTGAAGEEAAGTAGPQEEQEPDAGAEAEGAPRAAEGPDRGGRSPDDGLGAEAPAQDAEPGERGALREAGDTGGAEEAPEGEGLDAAPAAGDGAMSPDEARKLLDSVREGEPRVRARRGRTGRDW